MKKESLSSTMANRTLKKGSSIILSANRFDPTLADQSKRLVQTPIAVFPDNYAVSAGTIQIPARVTTEAIPSPSALTPSHITDPVSETASIPIPVSRANLRASSILSYADEEGQDTTPTSNIVYERKPNDKSMDQLIEEANRESKVPLVDYNSPSQSNQSLLKSDQTVKRSQSPCVPLFDSPSPHPSQQDNPILNYHNPYNNTTWPNDSSQSQRSPSNHSFLPLPTPKFVSNEELPVVFLNHLCEIQDYLHHFVKSHEESHGILVHKILKNKKGINTLAENQIKSHENLMEAINNLNPQHHDLDSMKIDGVEQVQPRTSPTAFSELMELQKLSANISSLGAQIGAMQTSISNIENRLNSASISSQRNVTNPPVPSRPPQTVPIQPSQSSQQHNIPITLPTSNPTTVPQRIPTVTNSSFTHQDRQTLF